MPVMDGIACLRALRLDVDLAHGPLPATGLAAADGAAQLFSSRVACRNVLDFFGAPADPTSFCLR